MSGMSTTTSEQPTRRSFADRFLTYLGAGSLFGVFFSRAQRAEASCAGYQASLNRSCYTYPGYPEYFYNTCGWDVWIGASGMNTTINFDDGDLSWSGGCAIINFSRCSASLGC